MDDKYNLIYNGAFDDGSNGWNVGGVFNYDSGVTYDGSEGSLRGSGSSWVIIYLPLIPIDTACTYNIQFDVMSVKSASSYNYCYVLQYDKYGKDLMISDVNHVGDTTLAAELKNGDTAITISSNASSFYVNAKTDYYAVGICDSPAWGYNRHLYSQVYIESAVNTTNNTIPLKSAWNGGTWKVGTPIAKFTAGATYVYPAMWNSMVLDQWFHKTYNITDNSSGWRYSAVNAKLGQSVSNNWKSYFTNYKLENISNPQEREYNGERKTSSTGNANIQKTAMANCYSVHESSSKNVRWIRDWNSGNTVNTDCHWCEIQAWDKYGRNVALGSRVSGYTSTGTYKNINIAKSGVNNSANDKYIKGHAITKGTPTPGSTYAYLSGGYHYVDVDLGQVFEIEKIIIWHYYPDGRTYYKTKTEISEDRQNWTTVFDSDVSGRYQETANGNVIDFSETNMAITMAGIYKTTSLYEI